LDWLSTGTGKANYIAIVHADGNNMGNRIKQFTIDEPNNRKFVDKLRRFSQSVRYQGESAMKEMIQSLSQKLIKNIDGGFELPDAFNPTKAIKLKENYLPIRPIVFGGDDITFVADGRLGVSLAAKFVELFSKGNLADSKPGYACAGVTIVHTSYPFSQAYSLTGELTKASKYEAKLLAKDSTNYDVSTISWYFSTSGLLLDWETIEEREYKVKDGLLRTQPVILSAAPSINYNQWRSWDTLIDLAEKLNKDEWINRRNKVKLLQKTLRQGKDAVVDFTSKFGMLPEVMHLPTHSDVQSTGWYGTRCIYYDAIEASDMFIFMR
jgi:hypothetical protein